MSAVIGLDLSLTGTGIARVDGTTFTVVTKPAQAIGHRLATISNSVTIEARSADIVVIEDLLHSTQSAGKTGQVHGVVHLTLWRTGVPVCVVPPATLKKYATGKGNADKTAMAMAAYKRAGREFTDDNQCDAWWLRNVGLHLLGCPEVAMPAVQTDALAKLIISTPKAAA